MALQARQVLEDCKMALEMLEEEKKLQRWRGFSRQGRDLGCVSPD